MHGLDEDPAEWEMTTLWPTTLLLRVFHNSGLTLLLQRHLHKPPHSPVLASVLNSRSLQNNLATRALY